MLKFSCLYLFGLVCVGLNCYAAAVVDIIKLLFARRKRKEISSVSVKVQEYFGKLKNAFGTYLAFSFILLTQFYSLSSLESYIRNKNNELAVIRRKVMYKYYKQKEGK